MFSLNKCWWQLHTFSFIGRRTFGPSEGPFSHPHRRVGCDSWRLHWGTIRELGHSVSVQCFIMTSLFVLYDVGGLTVYIYLYIFLLLLSVHNVSNLPFNFTTWKLFFFIWAQASVLCCYSILIVLFNFYENQFSCFFYESFYSWILVPGYYCLLLCSFVGITW